MGPFIFSQMAGLNPIENPIWWFGIREMYDHFHGMDPSRMTILRYQIHLRKSHMKLAMYRLFYLYLCNRSIPMFVMFDGWEIPVFDG